MNWLNLLDEETDLYETPRSFIYWAGIVTIAAIASPNVALNKGGAYMLSPNIYCLLVATSGIGKGLPVSLASKLVENTKSTRVLRGRSTIQWILRDLSMAYTVEGSDGPITDARGFIASSEFATSIQRDPSAFELLTDLYDVGWHGTFANRTKAGGVENIKSPCITLFGGASPDHFDDIIPKASINGGFVGRTLIVQEEKRHRINPLTNTDTEMLNLDKLGEHLKDVKKLKGNFNYTPSGKEYFEQWYEPFRKFESDDKTGTYARLNDHVLKVAMCINMARGLDMLLSYEDIEESVGRCMTTLKSTARVTGGKGLSEGANKTKKVVEAIVRMPDYKITRKKLLADNWRDFDSFELDRIIPTLEGGGLIITLGSRETTYQATQKLIDAWTRAQEKVAEK